MSLEHPLLSRNPSPLRLSPLSSEYGTHKIAKAGLWPCLSVERPEKVNGCSVFAWKRKDNSVRKSDREEMLVGVRNKLTIWVGGENPSTFEQGRPVSRGSSRSG